MGAFRLRATFMTATTALLFALPVSTAEAGIQFAIARFGMVVSLMPTILRIGSFRFHFLL